MFHKKKPLVILLIACISILILVFSFSIKFNVNIAFLYKYKNIPESFELDWNLKDLKKQIGNTCAAHSVMAVLAVEKNMEVNPYEIYNSIPEKYGQGYIYPWGITRYLSKEKILMKSSIIGFLSQEKRINLLKWKLSKEHPVIIVVGSKNYLHYITLLGYTPYGFYAYDSILEFDTNDNKPGNKTISIKEILNDMESAYFYGIYPNLVITSK
jgi:hypothetical protein